MSLVTKTIDSRILGKEIAGGGCWVWNLRGYEAD